MLCTLLLILVVGACLLACCRFARLPQGLGGTPLFFWEVLATFVFVCIAYPALFVRPSYGSFGPLYVGLALFAVLSTGGFHW
jgi:glycerol uptake facilitator-like aquaporin